TPRTQYSAAGQFGGVTSKIDTGKAVNDDLVVTESSGIESEVQNDNNMSGNDTDADDADIRPIYDEESMAKVQLTAECNIFAIGQQHTEQPKIINEGRVDQMEAHCIALELKYQHQALKSGQHGHVLNDESNKAKIKKEMDVLETINIELEHKVANLCKENETLKKHYKDLYDSIKITKSTNIEQTTSLLANNAALKAQIQEKVFAIAALKNDLRKLKGNSVDTKFANTSVLGKLVVQPLRNQSVVRQPNVFKIERPQMSKQRFASQVDGNHNLSKPVTQHYLPKKSESAFAKPDHMIASSSSRNRKLFDSYTSKVESDPPHGSNVDISNIHECKQTLDLSAGTSINVLKEQSLDVSAEVPSTDTIVMTSMIELESLVDPSFDEYFDGENQVVSKPSAVTTADTSDKCQQQPDSTSSTSSLATIVSADRKLRLVYIFILHSF
nr:hypothetical protein [Tanacetum cinerariifolium]